MPLPLDVRLMNLAASLLMTALALGLAAAGLWWGMRSPAFAIRSITVQGNLTHVSATSLRATVLPRLTGTFFTLDLQAARAAFQSVPWVSTAVVRRVFPDRLEVNLQEQVAVAAWSDSDGFWLNGQGQVFEAGNPSDADLALLPRLSGPRAQSAQVLSLYQDLAPLVRPMGLQLTAMTLTPRGDWSARLDTGAHLELGRGTPAEMAERLRVFAQSAMAVAARHRRGVRDIESADLRYPSGYALRLKGITTVMSAPGDSDSGGQQQHQQQQPAARGAGRT
jgi:cell division protein FtsQ